MVGDPSGQLPAAQLGVLPSGGQDSRHFFRAEAIPGNPGILGGPPQLSLPLLRPPSVISAPGHLQLGQQLAFACAGVLHLRQDFLLLLEAHTAVFSRVGRAVFLYRWTSRDRSATNCFRSWFSRFSAPISWRVASLIVSRISRSLPASMNSLVQA
jgi:hypothetical protein